MKITKKIILEFIEEEIDKINEVHPAIEDTMENPDAVADSKAALIKGFRDTALVIKNMDFDRKEVQLVDSIIDIVLDFANNNQGATTLDAILKFAQQRIGKAK